ncbi:kinase-like domain-containing protein [Blakeslea trispora]|nr:kinase-like domain-containing protein [Blakeslea trispora]
MTPSSSCLEQSSGSILENSSTHLGDWENTGNDKIVIGPDGTHILCDSPLPTELPPYSSLENSKNDKKPVFNKRSSTEQQRATKPRRVIGNYTLINTLGSGSMGKVRLAVHNITGNKLAVKIVPRKPPKDKKKEKDENREIRTIREASIMLLLHHPFIVSLKEFVVLDPYYYLFMEYVNGGQLLDYIIAHGKLKEKQARRFARQILSALDYCHRNSIVHRDLKIENILISQSGNIKIIDFGLSNLFSPRSTLATFCGSLYFAAPELLNAKNYTGPEVDIWSFGVVLYVLVCGKVPFDDQNMPALHEKIKRGVVDYPSHLSTDCKSVLSRMLVTNPAHRATVSEIIIHPWMNKGYDSPVENYLPERMPLSLPVDMEVVRGMTGFEFGTEEEIKKKLETIITSQEYQKAAKTLAERTAEIQRHHRQHQQQNHSRFSSHNIASKKAFALSNDDPQSIPAAYHPLVSIYHLVKERIDREKRLSAIASADQQSNIPDISLPKDIHAATTCSILEPSLFHTPDMFHPPNSGVAYGKKGKTHICADENEHNHALEPIENGLTRLFSRGSQHHHRRSSVEDNEPTDITQTNGKDTNVFRRLSLALSLSPTESRRSRKHSITEEPTVASPVSSSTSTPIQAPSSRSSSPRQEGPTDIEVAKAAAAAAAVASSHSHHSNSGNAFGNKISKMLPRRMTLGQNAMNIENHANFLNMVHGHHQSHHEETQPATSKEPASPLSLSVKQPAHPTNLAMSHQGTADENIKPVFLKGLFSVTTTSTKHPSVIRADLIRVLERIGVKWRESKGRFECVHMPSIDLNRVVNQQEMIAEEVSCSSSSEDNNLNSPATVPVPDLVVRFEIYIVKVPWLLGMHGLQFRRVGGDPWQYKNMCSRILAELKL